MSEANTAEKRPEVKAWEGRRYLRRKRILAVFVVVVTAPLIVPKHMENAVIVCLPTVGTKWRVGERCDAG
jgi:hypothetical protein